MKTKNFDESLDRILGFIYQLESKAKKDLETNLNIQPKQYNSNLAIPEQKSLYRTDNI